MSDNARRILWVSLVALWTALVADVSAEPGLPPSRHEVADSKPASRASDEAPPPPQADESAQAAEPLEEPDEAEMVDAASATKEIEADSQAGEPAQLEMPLDAAPPRALEDASSTDRAAPLIDAATLVGVQPGVTTRDELHQHWGEPLGVEKVAGGVRESFELGGFQRVRATIVEDVVESVAVQLAKPMAIEWLATELDLEEIEPVELWDDHGQATGRVYPERGVLLGFAPRSNPPKALQIVLQPVDAESFLARAEVRLSTRYADCLADLKQALSLQPASGRAHWLHAQLTLLAGELDEASKSIHKAIELEPTELEYRLTWAKLLAEKGDHAEAVQQLRDVIANSKATPLVLARAYCQWGDCEANGPKTDFAAAIKLHVQAVKLAEPLSDNQRLAVRRRAKQLLVEAHLAVARDIGLGRWQQKSTTLPKWLDKAARLADEAIAQDRADAQLKLRVYEAALAALAGMTHPPDPDAWIHGLTQLGASALDEAGDPGYKARVAWQLAIALGDAVEIEMARDRAAQALELGKLALECFKEGDIAGRELPGGDYARGRLYYRMGALAAIDRNNHKGAVAWFDQALARLERPLPPSAAANRGRHGEMLVSMAISYWEVSKRGEALRLTERGARLMEQAAADGLLARPALAVPYANLATMHEKLGRSGDAKKYSVLAASFQEPAAPEPRKKVKIIQGTGQR